MEKDGTNFFIEKSFWKAKGDVDGFDLRQTDQAVFVGYFFSVIFDSCFLVPSNSRSVLSFFFSFFFIGG